MRATRSRRRYYRCPHLSVLIFAIALRYTRRRFLVFHLDMERFIVKLYVVNYLRRADELSWGLFCFPSFVQHPFPRDLIIVRLTRSLVLSPDLRSAEPHPRQPRDTYSYFRFLPSPAAKRERKREGGAGRKMRVSSISPKRGHKVSSAEMHVKSFKRAAEVSFALPSSSFPLARPPASPTTISFPLLLPPPPLAPWSQSFARGCAAV